jgi:hypothetical protein
MFEVLRNTVGPNIPLTEEVALMRRMLLVLTVALIMAAMVVMAAPASATVVPMTACEGASNAENRSPYAPHRYSEDPFPTGPCVTSPFGPHPGKSP